MPYICRTPGLLRLFLILSQFAVWLSLALLLKFFCTEECIGGTFFNLRIAYLVFSVGGFLLSCIIYGMGIYEVLPSALFIIVTDFLLIISYVILSIYAAVEETIFGGNEILNSIILNQGAYAAAATFGFLTAILYVIDGFYHIYYNQEDENESVHFDLERNNNTRLKKSNNNNINVEIRDRI